MEHSESLEVSGLEHSKMLQKKPIDNFLGSFSVCFPQIFKQTSFLAEIFVEITNVAGFS